MDANAAPGHDSASEVDEDEAVVRAPRVQWQSEMAMPAVQVAKVHRKTGLARPDAEIAAERQTKTLRAMRDERARIAKSLPQPAQPDGVVGGAHEHCESWTPKEDEELLRLVPLDKIRPSWAEVTLKLTLATGNARSKKSVRCRECNNPNNQSRRMGAGARLRKNIEVTRTDVTEGMRNAVRRTPDAKTAGGKRQRHSRLCESCNDDIASRSAGHTQCYSCWRAAQAGKYEDDEDEEGEEEYDDDDDCDDDCDDYE